MFSPNAKRPLSSDRQGPLANTITKAKGDTLSVAEARDQVDELDELTRRLADPRVAVDYAAIEQAAANLAADQGVCRSGSKSSSQEQIEPERHNRRSEHRLPCRRRSCPACGSSSSRPITCGRVAVLEDSRQPGSLAAVRLPCKRKTCPVCGPIWQQGTVDHYVAMIADHPVVRRVVDPQAWRTLYARLRRAGAQYLRIEQAGGELVIYSTVGPGQPVPDLVVALVADVANHVGRINASTDWSRQPVHQRVPGRWRLLGLASVPLTRVVQVAEELHLYVGEVPTHQLPVAWAEAHLLRRTDDELAWRRFRRWVGLHWPERRSARRAA